MYKTLLDPMKPPLIGIPTSSQFFQASLLYIPRTAAVL